MTFLDHIVIFALIVQAWYSEKRFEAIYHCLTLLRERLLKAEGRQG